MKTNLILFLSALAFCGAVGQSSAQTSEIGRSWTYVATQMPDDWYGSEDAVKIADQVLLYQRESGGWPKNLPMHQPLTDAEKEALKETGPGMEPTLDNDATTTEMKFMAKMYEKTEDPRYRRSFERGLDYLLGAQYDNGGWPQFYPLRGDYYNRITYNDNAQVNIMNLLKEIFDENPQYGFVATPETVVKARTAFNKGVDCILKTQIYVDGKPTVWCAQHDEFTLAPAKARSYELPSFSGGESTGIVLLLMELPNPSPEVVASIEGAIQWFEEHKIEGIRVQNVIDSEGRDRIVVSDPNAPAIWARFYDLDTQEPYFCGRDGIKKKTLAEIERERRTGYSYYVSTPQRALDAYPAWKANR